MVRKRKAALPVKAGSLGKAASTPAANNSNSLYFRQRIKAAIVWAAARGILPVPWAEWMIQRGGLTHD